MARWSRISAAVIALAVLLWASASSAALISYAYTAHYYRVRAFNTEPPNGPPNQTEAFLPNIDPTVPASLQQGTAFGTISINTAAPPTGQDLGPGTVVYRDALTTSMTTSTGLAATMQSDLAIHVAPDVFAEVDSNLALVAGPVPVPGWAIVDVPIRWDLNWAKEVLSSTDLNDLPVFSVADFSPDGPPPGFFAQLLTGDIGIVLDGPDSRQAVLAYRIDSLTYLGVVPEPGSATVLAGALAVFGLWGRHRQS